MWCIEVPTELVALKKGNLQTKKDEDKIIHDDDEVMLDVNMSGKLNSNKMINLRMNI